MGTGTNVPIESAKITLVRRFARVLKPKKLSHAVMKISIKTCFAFFIMYSEYQLRQEFCILFRSIAFANDCGASNEF
jgi:hypothetical protein